MMRSRPKRKTRADGQAWIFFARFIVLDETVWWNGIIRAWRGRSRHVPKEPMMRPYDRRLLRYRIQEHPSRAGRYFTFLK